MPKYIKVLIYGRVTCQSPEAQSVVVDDRSITPSLSITCRVSPGANQGRRSEIDGSNYLTHPPAPRHQRPLLCLPLPTCLSCCSSTGHSPPTHSYSPGLRTTPCRRRRPTKPSRQLPPASDDALASRAMPAAYASPGMRWACVHGRHLGLCRLRADQCLV